MPLDDLRRRRTDRREVRSRLRERFTCGRWYPNSIWDRPGVRAGEHRWERRGRSSRCVDCSFCGSLHPEDVRRLLAGGHNLGTTTKSYKFYIESSIVGERLPDGFGKFYVHHAPRFDDDPDWWDLIRLREGEAEERLRGGPLPDDLAAIR